MSAAFLSHSSADDLYVAELEQFVRGLNYRTVFNDVHSVAPFDEFWPRIVQGIDAADVFVVVLSHESVNSRWVTTRFAARKWPGVERYFDWSFYSQGSSDSRQTSADLFVSAALTFFGDPDPTVGTPWERGERLAGLVRKYRTLMVLGRTGEGGEADPRVGVRAAERGACRRRGGGRRVVAVRPAGCVGPISALRLRR